MNGGGFRSSRFDVRGRRGEGGMGVVYEAIDLRSNQRVAIKALREAAPDALLRFKQEFRAMHGITHPNLVSLGELHQEDGDWFFTMEFVEGDDFVRWVRGSPADVSIAPTQIAQKDPGGRSDAELAPATDATHATLDVSALAQGGAPEPAAFDEVRLRDGLVQLARGLSALHASGRVHRDVKPANVMVTPQGRVVLIDFGLVDVAARDGLTADSQVLGTPAYMAPEQAQGKPVTPAADWYAVGVLLYECLTGRLPFDTGGVRVLVEKCSMDPPRPGSRVAGVPDDLDALCMRLLDRTPAKRPSEAAVRRLVGEGRLSSPPSARPAEPRAHFVGREPQMAVLRESLEKARRGDVATLVLAGPSGVGKTALLQNLRAQLDEETSRVVWLEGRSFERETVPFKAFDGVLDTLARVLGRLPAEEVGGLVPLHLEILVEAFPVLGKVKTFVRPQRLHRRVVDPQERRARLFGAVRELLQRLSARMEVVLALDVLQWADNDSLALLEEIVRRPDAPNVCVIATLRADAAANGEADASSPASGEGGVTVPLPRLGRALRADRLLAIGPLPLVAAVEHAERLLLTAGLERTRAPELARESGGHPQLIEALVWHVRHAGGVAPDSVRLGTALWARVETLPPDARRVVSVIAMAGVPISQAAARAAARLAPAAFEASLSAAQRAFLVRASGLQESDTVEPYHDQVRAAVAAHLDPDATCAIHRAIAETLAADATAAPELLAEQWERAREPQRAAEAALRAAELAMPALAFDHAARLYKRALDLGVLDPSVRSTTLVLWSDALARAGRGGEAAEGYALAIDAAAPGSSVELSRRRAEQLLIGGHLEEGRAALRVVLAAVEIAPPRGTLFVILSLLVRLAYLRLRGVRFVERSEGEVPPQIRARLDVLWSSVLAFMFIDTIRGMEFLSRFVILALHVGDPARVATALAAHSSALAATGGRRWQRGKVMLATAHELASKLGDPFLRAHTVSQSTIFAALSGDWRQARTLAREAEGLYEQHGVDAGWYLVATRRYLVFALFYLGELTELQRNVSLYSVDARRRGDLFATCTYALGVSSAAHLANDDPRRARLEAEEALGKWAWGGYTLQHLYALVTSVHADIYEGDGGAAWRRVAAEWPRVERSQLLRVRYIRILARHARASAALAAAAGDVSRRVELAASVERDARALAREGLAWATGLGELVRAGTAALAGQRAQSAELAESAARTFDGCSMGAFAAAARVRALEMRGGRAAELAALVASIEARGARAPRRFVRLLAPGFEDAE